MPTKRRRRPRLRANGAGSVYQRRDQRWVAAVYDLEGKRVAVYHHSREEAEAALASMLSSRAKHLPVRHERHTVGAFLVDWLGTAKPNIRPSVHKRYEELVRLHTERIAKLPLERLNGRDLERLYADRREAGLSPTTVHHLHAVLHRALGQAVRWGLLERNPADAVDAPKFSPAPRPVLNPDEVRRLLVAARESRYEAFIVLAVTTGMRRGELLGLQWPQVDLDAGVLSITQAMALADAGGYRLAEPKTRLSRRAVRLSSIAVDALRRWRTVQLSERLEAGPDWHDLGLVFTRPDGRTPAHSHIGDDILNPVLERAGLPHIRFHDLRHCFATLMLRERIPVKIVSTALGHSRSVITSDLYSHVDFDMQEVVAETIDRLFASWSSINKEENA